MYRTTQDRRNSQGGGGDTLVTQGGAVFPEAEFIALVEHYSDDLCGFLRRRFAEPSDIEDRAQECFEVLWRRRGEVDPTMAQAYLVGIARNVVAAQWRKRKREEALPDVQFFPDGMVTRGADERLELVERLRCLYRFLESLPTRQREVLELVYGRDLSIAEAGRCLGVSRGTVTSYHERALKGLAKRFRHDSAQS